MKTLILAGSALFLAGAFAGPATAEGDRIAEGKAGAEVDRICFARTINGFRTIDGEDNAVLLESGVNDWRLATLIGPCGHNQLRFAQGVAIDSRPRGGCVTPGDQLIFTRSAFGDFSFPNETRCTIDALYKWDVRPRGEDADNSDNEPQD